MTPRFSVPRQMKLRRWRLIASVSFFISSLLTTSTAMAATAQGLSTPLISLSNVVSSDSNGSGGLGSLYGVNCQPSGGCLAVGIDSSNQQSIAQLFQPRTGQSAPNTSIPTPEMGVQWNGVKCSSSMNCVIVGQSSSTSEAAVAIESNGAWAPTQLSGIPDSSDSVALNAVDCFDASSCVAVGEDTTTFSPVYALESNGVWGQPEVVDPNLLSDSAAINSISCSRTEVCWAVGQDLQTGEPLVLEFNTDHFSAAIQLPADKFMGQGLLNGVSCDDSGKCVAVGQNLDTSTPLIFTEDSGTWVESSGSLSPNGILASLQSVSCLDAFNCIAVGQDWRNNDAGFVGEVEGKWAEFSDLSSGGVSISGELYGVNCTTGALCLAVGQNQLTNQLLTASIQLPQSPTITLAAPPSTSVVGGSFTPSYQSNSDGAVTIISTTLSVCSVSPISNQVILSAAGVCALVAHVSTTTRFFAALSPPITFNVARTSQIPLLLAGSASSGLINSSIQLSVIGGSTLEPPTLQSSGGCHLFGLKLTAKSATTCVVTATSAGNANYLPTSTSQTFTFVQPAQAVVAITNPTLVIPRHQFVALSASGGSGVLHYRFSVSGIGCVIKKTRLSNKTGGDCVVTATNPANHGYTSATSVPVAFSFS